jgi:hypothetical protein
MPENFSIKDYIYGQIDCWENKNFVICKGAFAICNAEKFYTYNNLLA